MKDFMRSVAGKTLSFIMTMISACVLCASVALFVTMAILVEEGYNFFAMEEQQILDKLENDMVDSQQYGIAWRYASGMDMGIDENMFYRVRDEDGNVVYISPDANASIKWTHSSHIGINRESQHIDVFPLAENNRGDELESCWVDLALKEGGSLASEVAMMSWLASMAYRLRYATFGAAGCSLLGLIVFFVALMSASGRHPGDDGLYPGPLNKVPYDVLLFVCGGVIVGVVALLAEIAQEGPVPFFSLLVPFALAALSIFLGLCMSTAARIKQRTLLKNTVAFYCLALCWNIVRWLVLLAWQIIEDMGKALAAVHSFNMEIVRNIPIIWKTVVFLAFAAIVELVLILMRDVGAWLFMWAAGNVVLIPCALFIAIVLRRLQCGGAALARGDLSYHVDTRGMPADFKKHGENLNSIAYGMTLAVDDRLKSEHMKTELIANVSHDIKTPLTSIINYASLVANEPCDNEKVKEYAEVLVRQSEKLKKLLEDLVEVSKASTGNLDVALAPCDPSLFLMQAAGEYDDKMNERELTLVVKQCSEELRIMADGRRMWRIFDNLMNNICKYAQPGTRVYMTLEKEGGNAVITFKNTSRDELDMSEEELMERFARGDDSRNTEGNGLGLSIARSLAQLQNGDLRLMIDGDLFKAILSFPLIQ